MWVKTYFQVEWFFYTAMQNYDEVALETEPWILAKDMFKMDAAQKKLAIIKKWNREYITEKSFSAWKILMI